MAKQTGWIHGGKYVKPSDETDLRRHRSSAVSSLRRSNLKHSPSRTAATAVGSFVWKLLTRHVLPAAVVAMKAVIALAIATVGYVVGAVRTARCQSASNSDSSESSMQQPQQQPQHKHSNNNATPPHDQPENRGAASVASAQIIPPLQSPSLPSDPTTSLHSTNTASASTVSAPPSSSRATPAKSLLRTNHHSNKSSSSRRTSFGSKEPRSARRVLFFETAGGEVSRTEVLYDKELPASARKEVTVGGGSMEGVGGGGGDDVAVGYSPNSSVGHIAGPMEKERWSENRNSSRPTQNNCSPAAGTHVNQHNSINSNIAPLDNMKQSSSSSSLLPVNHSIKAPSPLATLTNKRPRDETNVDVTINDVIAKRRNLIAVSRYHRPRGHFGRPAYRTTAAMPIRPVARRNGDSVQMKRRREELLWNAVNKKNKVDNDENENENEEENNGRVKVLGKTPMKARPLNT